MVNGVVPGALEGENKVLTMVVLNLETASVSILKDGNFNRISNLLR